MKTNTVKTDKDALAVARRLLREAVPPRKKLYTLSIFCIIGSAVFTALLANSTRVIVNDVFVAGDAANAVNVALMVMVITMLKSAFDYANGVIQLMFSRSVSAANQKRLFRSTLNKDIWYFLGRHASAQMNQIKILGTACGKVVASLCNKALMDGLTLIALFGVMIYQDFLMTLVASLLFPLIFLLVTFLSRRIRAVANSETELMGAYFAIGAEAFDGIKTVKSYDLEEKTTTKFEEAVEKLEQRLLGIARVTSATMPVTNMLGGVVIGLFVIYAAWQTITEGKTPGEFTAFITAFLMAYQPAERLSKTWVDIQKSLTHVGRMYSILDEPLRRPMGGTKTLADADSSVCFDAVTFEYKADQPALRDVSFNVAAGERVAIVGRSGAGKSTLIDLVMRFYDPTSGVARIGGHDLRDVSEEGMREAIALISQDVFLFDGTIRENIRDGRPDATDEQIEDAAERAALGDFIASLPDGLDSQVGPNGKNLSGGQKQRVGIARALVKPAKVYIFDEATSALDVENERKILLTLVDGMEDSTMLFVTHRPSALEYVDRVMVLDHGHLVGFDTHEVLSDGNRTYRELFNLFEEEQKSRAV